MCFAVSVSRAADDAAALGKLLVKPDAHQTLVNPDCSHCVDEAKRRQNELKDDDRVLCWMRGKYDGGAIPVRFFLNPFRVISDTYGVFVYDPDAGYMKGYEPSLDFKFHGWRNGIMVMKHKDGTLYSCLSGKAFDGPRKGDQLKPVATLTTNWGPWLKQYPDTVAYHMFEKYQPTELPKQDSADSVSTRGKPDGRLPADAEVIGVTVGKTAKAYPVSMFAKSGFQSHFDELDGQKIAVFWHAETRTGAVFANKLDDVRSDDAFFALMIAVSKDGKLQNPSAPVFDVTTGSHFDITGRAIDGKLKGRTLTWLPSVQCRWFAWSAEYPLTALHSAKSNDEHERAAESNLKKEVATPGHVGKVEEPIAPRRGVIVAAGDATEKNVAGWVGDGIVDVVVVLDEAVDAAAYRAAAERIAAAKLDLHYWIEVARNPRLADAHPRWMASLGSHDDWRRRFPGVAAPKKGEVAKAYPWTPIGYREAFEAHLARVKSLLAERAAGDYRTVLLNDLQAGPAACGCGNIQCRWAIDYGVPATATKLEGDDVAARFLTAVATFAKGKQVVPVWTTECEENDLPAEKAKDGKTTGLCGGVGCATGICPKAFARQWAALLASHRGPVGLLALHGEFQRTGLNYPEPGRWVKDAVSYLDTVPAKHAAAPRQKESVLDHDRLWIVVQGYAVKPAETHVAENAAKSSGAAVVLTALARLDQGYEPRIASVDDEGR